MIINIYCLQALSQLLKHFPCFLHVNFGNKNILMPKENSTLGQLGGGGREDTMNLGEKKDIFNQACFPFLTLDQLKLIDQ